MRKRWWLGGLALLALAAALDIEGVARSVAGTLTRIAPAAEPGTRSIGVAVELTNPDENIVRIPASARTTPARGARAPTRSARR